MPGTGRRVEFDMQSLPSEKTLSSENWGGEIRVSTEADFTIAFYDRTLNPAGGSSAYATNRWLSRAKWVGGKFSFTANPVLTATRIGSGCTVSMELIGTFRVTDL